jgi:hypothetical protein
LGVIGLIDEDGQSIETRVQEIDDRLRERGQSAISAEEGRCLLIPTRNIETWLYWLTAQRKGLPINLNEVDNYKKAPPGNVLRLHDQDCRPAGKYLFSLNHMNLPDGCPSMLVKALSNLRSFLRFVKK